MKSPLSYAEKQQLKRRMTSVGITFGLYGIAFAVGIALSILNPQEELYLNTIQVSALQGPVTNSIGLGSIDPSDKGDEAIVSEAPAPVKTPEPSKKVEAPKTPVPEKPAVKPASKPEPAPIPVAPPKPATAPAAAAKADASSPLPEENLPKEPTPGAPSAASPQSAAAPVEPWVPGQRDQGSHISGTASMLYVPGKGNVPWTGSTINIHKAEKGTSSDTTLGGAQGTVGPNLYSPVYSSLPLPQTVSAAVYNAIPDLKLPPNTIIYSSEARKRAFGMYYEFDGSAYRRKSDVPLDQREPLWQILEDAGYNPANADYKTGRNLMPVVIGFSVTRDNQLKGVEVLQSSGDPEIDKSVVYGFKRASFWNKTGETVPGRFTYRF